LGGWENKLRIPYSQEQKKKKNKKINVIKNK